MRFDCRVESHAVSADLARILEKVLRKTELYGARRPPN
jgi:hypothetical protein